MMNIFDILIKEILYKPSNMIMKNYMYLFEL